MTRRVSFGQVNSIFDGLDQQGHVFVLGSIPNFGAEGKVVLKCQTFSMPGYGNEKYDMAVHGHVVGFRGRKTYPRTMSVTYAEDQALGTSDAFKSWHEAIVGSESGNSLFYKQGYSLRASVFMFDHVGKEIEEIRFTGLFPTDVADVNLDGQSSALVQVNVTFNYDRHVSRRIRIL